MVSLITHALHSLFSCLASTSIGGSKVRDHLHELSQRTASRRRRLAQLCHEPGPDQSRAAPSLSNTVLLRSARASTRAMLAAPLLLGVLLLLGIANGSPVVAANFFK